MLSPFFFAVEVICGVGTGADEAVLLQHPAAGGIFDMVAAVQGCEAQVAEGEIRHAVQRFGGEAAVPFRATDQIMHGGVGIRQIREIDVSHGAVFARIGDQQ